MSDPITPLVFLAISVGTALAARALTPKPKSQNTAPNQYQVPDASNAVPIPYLAGTYAISPNICFYGGYHVETHSHGSKSSKTQTQIAYLSYLALLCLGEVSALLRIEADDAVIYQGPDGGLLRGGDDATDITTTLGTIRFYWGTPTQTSDGWLETHAQFPTSSGFPNVCYAVFKDCALNSGYQVQRLVFVVKRVPSTPLTGNVEVGTGMNPAHVLYDILTNDFAGSRFTADDLDLDAFNAIAETLGNANVWVSLYTNDFNVADGDYSTSDAQGLGSSESYHVTSNRNDGDNAQWFSTFLGADGWRLVVDSFGLGRTVPFGFGTSIYVEVHMEDDSIWGSMPGSTVDMLHVEIGSNGLRVMFYDHAFSTSVPTINTLYSFASSPTFPGDFAIDLRISRTNVTLILNGVVEVAHDFDTTELAAINWSATTQARVGVLVNSSPPPHWGHGGTFDNLEISYLVAGAPLPGVNVLYSGTSLKDIVGAFISEYDLVMRVREGKLSPLAVRDDYDPTGLPVIYERNAIEIKRRREPFGSAANDLQFTYINAARAWRQDPIEIFNIGSLVALGRRQTTSMNLTLVTDLASASAIAARKLRPLNTPADTYSARVTPGLGCLLEIGDPVAITSDRLGVEHISCRVIDLQDSSDNGIQVSLQEDVYRISDAAFVADSGDIPRNDDLVKPARQRIEELPWDLVGETLQVALLFGRGSRAAIGAYLFESADDVEFNQVLTQTGFAVTGVLVGGYAATGKIDRTIGFTFDADSLDISGLATQSEEQFLRHESMALIEGELVAIKSLTPIAGGTAVGGRWRVDGVIRGIMDTDTAAHASGSVVYFVSSQEAIGQDAIVQLGASIYLKATPYSASAVMDLGDVDAAGPYVIGGRAFTPLRVENLAANGAATLPLYSGDINITWDYRVRGTGAGTGVPASGMLFAAAGHEGVFVIDVVVGGTVVRTTEINTDDTAGTGWTYTSAMNTADNGSPAAELQVRVRNRINAYYSIARAIIVRHT